MSDKKPSSKVTIDHEKIKNWAEDRGGVPARVKNTGDSNDPGILRIDFVSGDGKDENLEEISWDEFFRKFEEAKLAFLYQEETLGGEESRFFKFIDRDED